MTLDEQISKTEQEYNAYKNANFAAPEIIEWLRSVLESLYELKKIK
jgi:hypothetical protein